MSRELENALKALGEQRAEIAARTTPGFSTRLATLRRWQATRIRAIHQPIADRHDGAPLLDFLTRRFYLEADWSELTARPERVAARIHRILSDDRPLVIAVQLQHSADALDVRMAHALTARDATGVMTPTAYVHAFREVGELEQREQQIAGLEELVELLAGYAHNRGAYWAFKLAGGPARALGMGQTYRLLADGFAAMRATRDLPGATQAAARAQHRLLTRLLNT